MLLFFALVLNLGSTTLSTTASANVFWNECFDKGGVRVFLDKCECVDGSRFDPRQVDSSFQCSGVGSEMYYRMLNAGQIDRTGRRAPNVVEKYERNYYRLNRDCQMIWEAACYSARLQSCVCRNSYPIPLTEVWPNTHNCYGKFVSYGLDQDHTAAAGTPEFEGNFNGIVQVNDAVNQCKFLYGDDVTDIGCTARKTDGMMTEVTLDYSKLSLTNPPACQMNVIGRANTGIYIASLDNRKIVIRYKQAQTGQTDPWPVACVEQPFTEDIQSGEMLSINCAISSR